MWVLPLLALLQSLASLRNVRRWSRSVLDYVSRGPAIASEDLPALTLMVPCRGEEPGLKENLESYAHQRYADYELILVSGSHDDPSTVVAREVAGAGLVHAPPRGDEGEKVTKLREAVRHARPETRVLVFADSDGRPRPAWLRDLVSPLCTADPPGATTGYRWYVPEQPDTPSLVRAVWNSFTASALDQQNAVFCWGGSMALRRQDFEDLDIDGWWQGAVSDDYQLARALRRAGLSIRFVPTCLVANHSGCGWAELFSWTTRQIIITRVYAPKLWAWGLAANGLYTAALVAAAVRPSAAALALMGAAVLASMATGVQRIIAAYGAMPAERERLRRQRWAYVLLAPFIPLLLFYNFVAAGLTRSIEWRGTRYRLDGPQRVKVLHRVPQP